MMWARWCEAILGAWLIAGHWVLPNGAGPGWLAINDAVCGALCIAVAGVSCLMSRRPVNLLQIPIGLWVAAAAYFSSPTPATVVAQSDLLTAFFLLNFAIIPTRASKPPTGWLEEIGGRRKAEGRASVPLDRAAVGRWD